MTDKELIQDYKKWLKAGDITQDTYIKLVAALADAKKKKLQKLVKKT